jgi:integrase
MPEKKLNLVMPPDVLCQKKSANFLYHSWRHFFNTYLLSENVPLPKIKSVMGHSTGKGSMTENYEHFQPYMFQEVYVAQNKLLDMLLEGNVNLSAT